MSIPKFGRFLNRLDRRTVHARDLLLRDQRCRKRLFLAMADDDLRVAASDAPTGGVTAERRVPRGSQAKGFDRFLSRGLQTRINSPDERAY